MTTPTNILITGNNDPLVPYIRQALERTLPAPDNTILTLRHDLTAAPAPQPDRPIHHIIHIDTSSVDTIERPAVKAHQAARNLTETLMQTPCNHPRNIIYISSTEVYGHPTAQDLTEDTTPTPATTQGREKLQAEQHLTHWCRDNRINLIILRTAPIIGTRIQGLTRRLIHAIYRGNYRHIADGDQGPVSVIHATQLAQAIPHLLNNTTTSTTTETTVTTTAQETSATTETTTTIYNIADLQAPTWHQLTEALSHRIGHKRIFTLRPRHAHILATIGDIARRLHLPATLTGLTHQAIRERNQPLTYSTARLRQAHPTYNPTPATHYLTHHDYNTPETL